GNPDAQGGGLSVWFHGSQQEGLGPDPPAQAARTDDVGKHRRTSCRNSLGERSRSPRLLHSPPRWLRNALGPRRDTAPASATPRSRSARPSPIAGRPRPTASSARPKLPISRQSTIAAASTAARSTSS